MTEAVRVQGIKDLDAALASMGTVAGFKALRAGLRIAARPMFRAARSNAASTGIRGFDSGATAAAMGTGAFKLAPNKTAFFIGPKNANKKALAIWNAANSPDKPVKRLRHFHLLEFGSAHGPAQPYLRPAFDSTKLIVVQRFGAALREAIDKQAAKTKATRRA